MAVFQGAPVIQGVSLATVILTYTLSGSDGIYLDVVDITTNLQLYRMLSSQMVFRNTAQAVVGLLVLFSCREFERQMGSKKFGAFTVCTFVMSLTMLMSVEGLALAAGSRFVTSPGPFYLIFSLLSFFYFHIPRTQPGSTFVLFGIAFSSKSWTYLLAAQLMLSDGLRSAVPAMVGILCGYLYSTDRLGVQAFRLPSRVLSAISTVNSFFSLFIPSFNTITTGPEGAGGPNNNNFENNSLLGNNATARRGGGAAPRPRRPAAGAGAGAGGGFGFGGDGGGYDDGSFDRLLPGGNGLFNRGSRTPAAAAAPPSEESVERLISMGFERAAVVRALQSSGNNVETAANILLR